MATYSTAIEAEYYRGLQERALAQQLQSQRDNMGGLGAYQSQQSFQSYNSYNSCTGTSGVDYYNNTTVCQYCGMIHLTQALHRCGHPDYPITDARYYRREVSKQERAEVEKQNQEDYQRRLLEEDERARKRIEEKKNWKPGKDLNNEDKKFYLQKVREVYNEYKLERGWKHIMDGLKWFFIIIGLAIAVNFDAILEIIKLAVGGK